MYSIIAEYQAQAREVRTVHIAKALAWSARYGIPAIEALELLLPPRLRRESYLDVSDASWPCIGFSARLLRVLRDLEGGGELAKVLRHHLRGAVQGKYLRALVAGSEMGALDQTLLAADSDIRENAGNRERLRLVVVGIALAILYMIVFTTGFNAYIAPQFMRMIDEMMGASAPTFLNLSMKLSDIVVTVGPLIMLLAIFLAVFREVLACRDSDTAVVLWVQDIVAAIPFLGLPLRHRRRAAVARTMAGTIDAGLDLSLAAEVCDRASPSFATSWRVESFRRQLSEGLAWEKAWVTSGLGRASDHLYLRPAALRNDPATGFRQLAADLEARAAEFEHRFVAWTTRGLYVATALLAGTTVICMWVSLLELVTYVTGGF